MITSFIACAGSPNVHNNQKELHLGAQGEGGYLADVENNQTGPHPIIGFYERFISPVDGERCPMHPTCSAYARKAVQRHGLFMGWIMGCDRLVRCGRDETKISPGIIKDKNRATLDPVSANDFWWYKEP
ncbi:MAG: membrane protein insertion efficiency factor YidD [Desulfobacterium sp.]|nr:membrane protein insertion efficiency factor YidD [Desulfobacterium sp.]